MRLVMVAAYPAPGAAPVGGPQIATTRLVSALSRCGVEITIVAPAAERRDERAVELGERVRLVEIPADGSWSLLKGLRALRRDVRLVIERLDADLVHAQELVPYGVAATAAPSLPLILTAHGSMRADTLAATPGLGGISRAHLRCIGSAGVPSDELTSSSASTRSGTSTYHAGPSVSSTSRTSSTGVSTNSSDGPSADLFCSQGGPSAIKGGPYSRRRGRLFREAREARLLVVGWSPGVMPELTAHTD